MSIRNRIRKIWNKYRHLESKDWVLVPISVTVILVLLQVLSTLLNIDSSNPIFHFTMLFLFLIMCLSFGSWSLFSAIRREIWVPPFWELQGTTALIYGLVQSILFFSGGIILIWVTSEINRTSKIQRMINQA